MEVEQIVVPLSESSNPTGEVVSPELTEESAGMPVPVETEKVSVEETPEQAEERAEIEAAGLTPDTAAAHKWAQMRRERRDAKRAADAAILEAARWQGRAEALAERGQVKEEAPAPPKLDLPPRPQMDDFEDYDDFRAADTDWLMNQKIAELEAKFAQKEADKTKAETDKQGEEWINQGKTKYPDFEVLVTKSPQDGGPAINHAMADFINSSPVSHELAYHLGKNVPESRRIAALPPMAAARELAKLEDKFTAPTSVKPRTQTNAPAPIKPIAGDNATAVTVELEKLSPAEYIAEMDRREFGKR